MSDGAILCAVALDDSVDAALETAGRLGDATGLPVRFAHVAEVDLTPGSMVVPGGAGIGWAPFAEGDYAAAQRRAVESALESLAEHGLPQNDVIIKVGSATSELDDLAAELRAEAIVVGARPRGALAAAATGSVARWLTVNGDRPVIFARREPELATAAGPVLCGVDPDDDGAPRTVAAAARFATQLDRPLVLLHVADGDADPAVVRRLDELAAAAGVPAGVDVALERGAEPERLSEAAEDRNAPLIVVGCRGHGALRSALTGSVSLQVANTADRVVAVVPPHWPPRGLPSLPAASAATDGQ